MTVKLSILNYGYKLNGDIDSKAKSEDDHIIKIASPIVKNNDFGKGALIVSEVLHTDIVNNNFRYFPSTKMADNIKTYYDPTPTPFLMFHDSLSKPAGSNIYSKYFKRRVETLHGDASGLAKVATFIPDTAVFDEEKVIDLIAQRRILALSQGSRSSRDSVICSICNSSIYECDHYPGRKYDDKLCYMIYPSPLFREYSACMGDQANLNAMIRRMDVYDNETDGTDIIDELDMKLEPMNIQIYEDINKIQVAPGFDQSSQDNNTNGENIMDAELISSYEARIKTLTDSNTALTSALTNANAEINRLTLQISDSNTSSEENNDNIEDTDTNGSSEEATNENTNTEPESDETTGSDENTDSENADDQEGTDGSSDSNEDPTDDSPTTSTDTPGSASEEGTTEDNTSTDTEEANDSNKTPYTSLKDIRKKKFTAGNQKSSGLKSYRFKHMTNTVSGNK